MPGARITTKGQGSKLIIDILNLVNITLLNVVDLRIQQTNTEPKRVFVFEFQIDGKDYRCTMRFTDETLQARDLLGRLKSQEEGQAPENRL